MPHTERGPEFKAKRKAFRQSRRSAKKTLKEGGTLSKDQRRDFKRTRRQLVRAGGNPGAKGRKRRREAGLGPGKGGVLGRDRLRRGKGVKKLVKRRQAQDERHANYQPPQPEQEQFTAPPPPADNPFGVQLPQINMPVGFDPRMLQSLFGMGQPQGLGALLGGKF